MATLRKRVARLDACAGGERLEETLNTPPLTMNAVKGSTIGCGVQALRLRFGANGSHLPCYPKRD